MSAATSPSPSKRPAIIAVAILLAASAPPGPSAAGGQEPKTWTLSDCARQRDRRPGLLARRPDPGDGRLQRHPSLRRRHGAGAGDPQDGEDLPAPRPAFSPDGKTLASGCYQVVQFWDVPAALRGQASKLDR